MPQYRSFVKDCLNLNGLPKAWFTIDTFTVNEDLLSKATSTFKTIEGISDNVDNGDIFVLVNPIGKKVYAGVIDSFTESNINTSQMQSFYRGLWVYRTDPKAYLEQEVKSVTEMYAEGLTYGSLSVDTLMAQEKEPIYISCVPFADHSGLQLRSQDDN